MIVHFDVGDGLGWKFFLMRKKIILLVCRELSRWKFFQIRKIFNLLVCGKLRWCENIRCVSQNLEGIAIGSGHMVVGKAALPLECNFVITGVIGREAKCDAALYFFYQL